jgi:prepilin signal peptidase PulO-like enzyme (type II secretory pathway)
MMLPVVLLCVAAFALAAALGCYAARLICLGVEPLPDGPPSGDPHTKIVIAASGVLGAIAAVRGLPPIMLAIFCFVCGILAAIWYADTVRGIVPDVFTLLPLAAIGIAAGFSGRWDVIVSALVPTIPFAIVAYASKGRGMGWGDVKLAALGGALLGMQNAVLAFALASIVAIVVSRFRADRTRPMALAPYLVAGIAVPLALQAAVR